jgi:hypothetical protein
MVGRYNLVSVTGYLSPADAAVWKGRMRRLRALDHRLTESRILEEALKDYVPKLEAQKMPTHKEPALRRRRAVGE